MDFQKMWFNLKEELNKKNSWGKNELKSLMEEIEVKNNKASIKVKLDCSDLVGDIEKMTNDLKLHIDKKVLESIPFVEDINDLRGLKVEEFSEELSNRLKERMKNKGGCL